MPEPESQAKNTGTMFESGLASAPKPRIVIVDDDEAICTMLRTFFESLDYEVLVYMSPVTLFQQLDHIQADIILLDVMMSWIDGYRVCELLKSHPGTRDIPILMMSALSGQENIRRGLDQAEDYFVKPVSLNRLQGRINELLTSRMPN